MTIKLRNGLSGVSRGIDYNGLKRFRESSNQEYRQSFMEEFQKGLEEGHLQPGPFSIRRLWEALVENGREMVDSWHPENQGSSRVRLEEAGGATMSADFTSINGQIVYAAVLEAWNNPNFIHPDLVEDIQTPFSGEKIAGIGNLGDVSQVVREGDPYPTATVSPEYIETPQTTKRGFLVPVTKEAIFFDRTGLLLQRVKDVTQSMLISKEKRCLDMVLGVTSSYRRNGSAAQTTYATSHTNGDFSNLKTSNGLVDYTNIEAAELMFDAISDPNTGEPVMIDRTNMQLLVPRALEYVAAYVQNKTNQIHRGIDQGGGAATFLTKTTGQNPLKNMYSIISNAYVYLRGSSNTSWWIGDFKRAFKYRQNWPITPVTIPASSHEEIHNDIVQNTKISEMGTPSCENPWYVLKNTA